MSDSIKRSEQKRFWAAMHPEKMRAANFWYRKWNKAKLNRQAAARMRRYRQRLRVTPGTKS